MPDYRTWTLAQQLAVLEQEQKNAPLLHAKAQMWGNVTLLLNQNGDLVRTETDKLEPDWTDDAGLDFVARARNTQGVLAEWVDNITGARPDRPLLDLSIEIPKAFELATKNKASLDQTLEITATHPSATTMSEAEIQRSYAEPSGAMMNHIAELYRQAGAAVAKAVDGRLPDEVAPKNGGGAGGGGVPPGIGAGGGGAGGIPGGLPGGGGGAPVGLTDGGGGTNIPGPTEGVDTIGGGAGGLPPVNGGGANTGLPPGGANPPGPTEGIDTIGGGGAGVGPVGAGGGAGGVDQNPELSGLGGAPITSPSLSGGLGGGGGGGTGLPGPTGGVNTIPPITGPVTGGGGTGTRPITNPIGGGPGGGGGGTNLPGPTGGINTIPPITGGGTGSGNSTGTGSGAGVKLPGVNLGGGGLGGGVGGGIGGVGGGVGGVSAGSSSIPSAGAPFQAPAAPAPSGAAPGATPLTGAGGTGSGGAGSGGMMPPMGGGMGAGAGGGLSSGAASRPAGNSRNRRKEREVTPGLPVMLSGKAGQADMNAFTGRGRKQVEESDVPTTVQLIDEDLWQVEQKQVDERVVAPVRRRAH